MRLIDADELRERIEFHVTSVSVCATSQEAYGRTQMKALALQDVDESPAVDAIPVEWLAQRSFETSYNGAKPNIDLNYAFCTVINEWQKERESANENHTG